LLREMVFNELGDDPEHLFASFDTRAYAAASLGQVHRARTKSGQDVAVKIQYPGIGRTVSDDFRNLSLALLPARLFKDWENTRAQFDDLQSRIQEETDYRREAANLTKAASLFRPEDGIVIPRVYPDLSTDRILTMDYLPGLHLDDFLATDPPQHLRDAFALKICRAWYRLLFAGRTIYVDIHPGNFLFFDDGRLGLIDFGCMLDIDDRLWDFLRKMDRPLTTGRREDRIAVLKEWCQIGDDPRDADRLRVTDEYTDWSWRARYTPGPFDFSDRADFQRGIDLFVEMVRKRYSRAQPSTPIVARQYLAFRSLLYRLRANIDITPLVEQEILAANWDRSDYAPPAPPTVP
jgi:predicted unusual protein kinase regulating ubiquinone biosynthesis (AarF/ABC1/UbiB family)